MRASRYFTFVLLISLQFIFVWLFDFLLNDTSTLMGHLGRLPEKGRKGIEELEEYIEEIEKYRPMT